LLDGGIEVNQAFIAEQEHPQGGERFADRSQVEDGLGRIGEGSLRLVTPKPEPATTGSKFLDSVGIVTHWLLYISAFGMGLSGLMMAIQSGLFHMVATGSWDLVGGFYNFTILGK
jgi:hypothetical protein